jgi:hypothetical protein
MARQVNEQVRKRGLSFYVIVLFLHGEIDRGEVNE